MSKVRITENEKDGSIKISVNLIDDDMEVLPDQETVIIQMPERETPDE